MSIENIQDFHKKIETSEELQVRITEIRQKAATYAAEELARLAAEVGTPFIAEELFTFQAGFELSEQDLATVAGGASVIVKKEAAEDSYANVWGLMGKMHSYTTDCGKNFSCTKNYSVGDAWESSRRPIIHF